MKVKRKIKLAACVGRGELFKPVKDWSLIIADRRYCETDEDFPQVIPYIILKNQQTSEYFQYRRGKVGQEKRLHGQISVGVGGHIDSLPKGDILEHIAKEAVREIYEEVGYDDWGHYLGQEHLKYEILKCLMTQDYLIIDTIDSSNQVNRVHVGICIMIEVNPNRITAFENGVILEPEWVSKEELKTKLYDETSDLELWSKIALQWIFGVNTNFSPI